MITFWKLYKKAAPFFQISSEIRKGAAQSLTAYDWHSSKDASQHVCIYGTIKNRVHILPLIFKLISVYFSWICPKNRFRCNLFQVASKVLNKHGRTVHFWSLKFGVVCVHKSTKTKQISIASFDTSRVCFPQPYKRLSPVSKKQSYILFLFLFRNRCRDSRKHPVYALVAIFLIPLVSIAVIPHHTVFLWWIGTVCFSTRELTIFSKLPGFNRYFRILSLSSEYSGIPTIVMELSTSRTIVSTSRMTHTPSSILFIISHFRLCCNDFGMQVFMALAEQPNM